MSVFFFICFYCKNYKASQSGIVKNTTRTGQWLNDNTFFKLRIISFWNRLVISHAFLCKTQRRGCKKRNVDKFNSCSLYN